MTGRYRLKKETEHLNLRKVDERIRVPANLGLAIGGSRLVEVPTRTGYHYARIRGNLSEVVQVYNAKTSPVYDLPVLISFRNNRWEVEDRDTGRYQNWGSSAYLPAHGAQHSFDPNSPGGDIVWVFDNQMMPLAPIPSGSSGAGNILIEYYPYWSSANHQWQGVGATGTANILAYKPTGSNARMVLVYMDVNGNPQLLPGSTYFAANITGSSAVLPYIPALPSNDDIPVAGIRLTSGTSSILWQNIYGVRPWFTSAGGTGSSGGVGPQGPPGPAGATVTGTSTFEFSWYLDGYITTGSNVAAEYVSPRDQIIEKVIFKVKGLGTTGTSIVDINLNGASIFSTRPTIQYNDLDGIDIVVPNTTSISQNDVLTLDIDSFAQETDSWSVGVVFTGWVTTTGTSGGHVIQDDGTPLTQRANLNFVGSGFVTWDDAGNGATVISGTASAGSQGPAGPPGVSGENILIYDDNTFITTGSAIHFNSNLDVLVTGSSVWVNSINNGNFVYTGGIDLYDTDSHLWDGSTGTLVNTWFTFNPTNNSNAWPNTASAVIVLVMARWASASNNNYLKLAKALVNPPDIILKSLVADIDNSIQGLVATTDAQFYMAVLGASTTATMVRLLGYYT